jgi:hypothetical protein
MQVAPALVASNTLNNPAATNFARMGIANLSLG